MRVEISNNVLTVVSDIPVSTVEKGLTDLTAEATLHSKVKSRR